jgi:hypothetical protein
MQYPTRQTCLPGDRVSTGSASGYVVGSSQIPCRHPLVNVRLDHQPPNSQGFPYDPQTLVFISRG